MENKYRFWELKSETMVYDLHIKINKFTDASVKLCTYPNHIPQQCTGYKFFDKDGYIGDFVSNNFGTEKEVIRQICFSNGTLILKRVKGQSSLPRNIPLHEHYRLNYRIIGNCFENPEVLKNGN